MCRYWRSDAPWSLRTPSCPSRHSKKVREEEGGRTSLRRTSSDRPSCLKKLPPCTWREHEGESQRKLFTCRSSHARECREVSVEASQGCGQERKFVDPTAASSSVRLNHADQAALSRHRKKKFEELVTSGKVKLSVSLVSSAAPAAPAAPVLLLHLLLILLLFSPPAPLLSYSRPLLSYSR